MGEGISVAVVEGQRQSVRRGAALAQAFHQLLDREHGVVPRDVFDTRREHTRTHRREERIPIVVHAMERQDRNADRVARPCGERRHRAEQPAPVDDRGQRPHRPGPSVHAAAACRRCHSSSINRFQSTSP